MKTVLLVDTDCLARARAVRAFAQPELLLLTASTYLEALWVLGEHEVDLALVDLGLPERESFELLAYLANCCPKVAVVTMSTPWSADRSSQDEVSVLPWRSHLNKPVRTELLLTMTREVLQSLEGKSARPMSLHDLLRVLSHERETCTLKVNAGPRSGQLQLFCGELIHAACDGAEGGVAMDEMLTWREVWMRVDPLPSQPQLTLSHRLEQLVVEESVWEMPATVVPMPATSGKPAPVVLVRSRRDSALRRAISWAERWVSGQQAGAAS
ncbi:response regulator [Hyalangium rubrum]|uniref:DUF4388 domain-containing protein n=1 Tax=Hyalangium rubrum TaxID=3103134 RepID=A0ABU5H4F1_9BACT|nr:response regulator [Hyalangium sp. s54d21]MDY7227759.1 DUF4388 domain-containing protein [Hyalangium sp. s54d21]